MDYQLPKKVGLLFGTFDPIHKGHIHVATQMIQNTDIDMVLFMVTPCSPHKIGNKMSSFEDRYNMVDIALKPFNDIKPCDYEKYNTPPYYSINTLNRLRENHSGVEFVYIMGSDNAVKLNTWVGIDEIMDNHCYYVFKREPYSSEEVIHVISSLKNGYKNKLVDIEPYNISSTEIRNGFSMGLENEFSIHLPKGVREYIDEYCLYGKK